MRRQRHGALRGKSGELCLEAGGFISALDRLDQRDRRSPLGDNDLFPLFGVSQVFGQTILKLLYADGARKNIPQVAIVATLKMLSSREECLILSTQHSKTEKSEAHRQAQLTTMKEFSEPFYWAANQLTGEP